MVVILAIAAMGAQPAGRLHRAHLVRPRRLVRHRRLCGGARAEALVPRPDRAADRAARCVFVAVLSTVVGLPHPAPARRLLLAADAGAGGADLHHRVPLDRGDRRRGRPRRADARPHRADRSRRRARLLHRGRADRARRAVRAAARRRARRSATCWWRSARTSCAPRSRAIRSSATSWRRSCSRRW